jgi:RimJ/RimL family protein N-acetyltransferase
VPDLRLEPLGPEHRDDLDALIRDPLVGRYTRIPYPPPPDQADVMISRYETDDVREGFAVCDENGAFVGVCMLVGIDREASECELGYMTAPAARGRGHATEMLRLLTEHALRDLGMHRLVLHIGASNTASERVARANGYVGEGTLRDAYVKPGVREDTTIWSRLVTDP